MIIYNPDDRHDAILSSLRGTKQSVVTAPDKNFQAAFYEIVPNEGIFCITGIRMNQGKTGMV